MKRLHALALTVLLAAAVPADDRGWTYRSDLGGVVYPEFVSSADDIFVYELHLSPYREQIRFLSATGDPISDVIPVPRGLHPAPGHLLLVDQWHIAVQTRTPVGMVLVPEDSTPSPAGTAFIDWATQSGGVAQHVGSLSGSTNPYADLSCAIGNNGSIAVWRTSGPLNFRASPSDTIPSTRGVLGVYCLEAEGRIYVAVSSAHLDHASVRIYEAGARAPTTELPTVIDSHRYALTGRAAGGNLLLGMNFRYENDNEVTYIATRISFSVGEWRIESATLGSGWPNEFRLNRPSEILLLPSPSSHSLVRVPWPAGATSIPYAPQPAMRRPPGMAFASEVSPSGRIMVWTNGADTMRITSAP